MARSIPDTNGIHRHEYEFEQVMSTTPTTDSKEQHHEVTEIVTGMNLPLIVYFSKSIGVRALTSPLFSDVETKVVTMEDFKTLVTSDQSYLAKVIPALTIIAGLPASYKSTALQKMLQTHVKGFKSSSIQSESSKKGICDYNILGVGLRRKEGWFWIEVDCDTAYNFPAICALTDERGVCFKLKKESGQAKMFECKILNDHLQQVYKSLYEHRCFTSVAPKEQDPNIPIIELKEIPHGVSMLNIWDIGFNKAILHSLSALTGLLDRCFSCHFLNLERDADHLPEIPDTSDPRFADHLDTKLLMQWRPRIYYLLRQALLARSQQRNRKQACLIVATHDGTSSIEHIQKKMEIVKNFVLLVADQVGVADLLVPNVLELNVNNDESVKSFKREVEKMFMIHEGVSMDMPLSWIFLRSAFYSVNELYIEKECLRLHAKELKITDDDFEHFLTVFTSFGSLIYDKDSKILSKHIILKPIDFFEKMQDLSYPNQQHSFITEDGIIPQHTAEEILGVDNAPVTMKIIASMGLAVELKSSQIHNPTTNDAVYYYMPHIRSTPPDTKCSPNCLHILFGLDTAPVNTQVVFMESIMNCLLSKSVKLVSSKELNVTCISFEGYNFSLVYHGDAIEVHMPDQQLPPSIADTFCQLVIDASLTTVKKRSCAKYAFALSCLRNDHSREFQGRPKIWHYLPDEKLCEECFVKVEYLACWNKAIVERNIPEEDMLYKDAISLPEMNEIATAFAKKSDKIESLATRLEARDHYDRLKTIRDKQKLVLCLLMEWENDHIKNQNNRRPTKTQLCEVLFELEFYDLAIKLDLWTPHPRNL